LGNTDQAVTQHAVLAVVNEVIMLIYDHVPVDIDFSRSDPPNGYAGAPIGHGTDRILIEAGDVGQQCRRHQYDPVGGVVTEPWPIPHATGARHIALSMPAMSFGPFDVLPQQRLLMEGGRPIHLGSRAFDILIALIERAGELVSKGELMARVWPNTLVEESNLKVQIAALRRTLRDGEMGNRYISNVIGRGYWFVAPVTRSTGLDDNTSKSEGYF
jgi:DNA-binding winged helix-turn-helix (wHTH) protein